MDAGAAAAILALAFGCEVVDSSLGMGYGTILSPLLLLLGFAPQEAVPAVLLSQAIGGGVASVFHHRLGNADFHRGTRDTRVMLVLAALCVLATILAAIIGISSAPRTISLFISTLVIGMGALILANLRIRFTWGRMLVVGIVSAFNKGISGGGFGPVVAGGLVIVGQDARGAVAATTAAEVPVCLAGFLTYLVATAVRVSCEGDGMSCFLSSLVQGDGMRWDLAGLLCLGAASAGLVGPRATRLLARHRMNRVLGALILLLGIATLVRTLA